jgi:hypothetical protein
MSNIATWLDGKKSIIGTLALGILGILASTGVVSIGDTWYQVVILLVATFTGVSFRAAIAKSGVQ